MTKKTKKEEPPKSPAAQVVAELSPQTNAAENFIKAADKLMASFPESAFAADAFEGFLQMRLWCEQRTSEAVEWRLQQAIDMVVEDLV